MPSLSSIESATISDFIDDVAERGRSNSELILPPRICFEPIFIFEQIKQHVDEFTILQRETNQWRDRAKNWQEHFLRVEEERCSLASRVDELEAERLVSPGVHSIQNELLPTLRTLSSIGPSRSAKPIQNYSLGFYYTATTYLPLCCTFAFTDSS